VNSLVCLSNRSRLLQIQYLIEHFCSANPKTKLILQENILSLIATLAYDDISSNCDRQREMMKFQLMTISIDSIMANYKLKDYAQGKVNNIIYSSHLYLVIILALLYFSCSNSSLEKIGLLEFIRLFIP
jgi:hypothetical protein